MSHVFYKWLPVIDQDLCTGCTACVDACGPKSLLMVDRLPVLVRPDTCGSEEHCIAPCPMGAIRMTWLEFSGDTKRGRWRRASFSAVKGSVGQ